MLRLVNDERLGTSLSMVGIDLAGVETRETGFCVLDDGLNVETCILFTDEEIVEKTLGARPNVVAIDAPLSLPKGRCCLRDDCPCRNRGIHFRECDKELLKIGIKFFPITLGPMRKLTERGIRLKQTLENRSLMVIEVYPGGAQDVLSIPRKQKGLNKLSEGLKKIGVNGLSQDMKGHELDAVTSALVGKFFIENEYTALGNAEEGLIIMPKHRR